MTIISPNKKFQAGTFEINIIVEADSFIFEAAILKGNFYFAY